MNPKNKKLTIFTIIITAPILYLLIFVSNFSGECEEVGRKLTDEELLQKGASMKYPKNPDCCLVEGESEKDSGFINNLFGKYYYSIVTYVKRKEPITSDKNYPYDYQAYLVDQCGKPLEGSSLMTTGSEKSYNWHVDRIKAKKEGTK
jgi:hypothetical protein